MCVCIFACVGGSGVERERELKGLGVRKFSNQNKKIGDFVIVWCTFNTHIRTYSNITE